ncbi:phosphotransferase enzyme family protein [Schaalia sp. Marseille-Q2122]|uniref:phosphotransferase enzyme family protein n=1 Tax=Schaalia sp. Marseille-Q2122 TaxID=2736604 RepID=UPI00158E08A5|nr:phosphotransferase [Schaalia sp. Marseille-Q2122]
MGTTSRDADLHTTGEDTDSQTLDISPVWAPITLHDAQRVCAALAQPAHAITILSVSARPTAAASLVDTDRGLIFLKRYAASAVTADHLAVTHRYVNHLAAEGLPTPPFLPFSDGRTTWSEGEALWEVCEGARGEDRYRDAHSWLPPHTLDEAREIGRQCARIAVVGGTYEAPRSAPAVYQSRFGLFAGGADTLDARLDAWVGERPHLADFCREQGVDLQERLDSHRQYAARIDAVLTEHAGEVPTTWTHGDLHCSNLMWEPGTATVTSIIDFGLADRNWSVYDLAVAIERNAFLWLDIGAGHSDAIRRDVAQAVIDGYESVRPLTAVERALLPAIMPLVQAEAALNWITYQWGTLRNAQAATWSLEVFFGAHTHWFDTPEGVSFTHWLSDILAANGTHSSTQPS